MEENRELTRAELVEQDAKECFKQGLNCSECVMTAFLNHFDTGLPKEVVKLATGFGGGMGHTKNTCGAITGAEPQKYFFHLNHQILCSLLQYSFYITL